MVEDKDVDAQIAAVTADVAVRRQHIVPGNSGIKRALSRTLRKLKPCTCDAFSVAESCTGCGTCARACPLGNVRLEGSRPSFGGNCMGCLACVNICPAKAIGVKGEKQPATRYRRPGISRADILSANCHPDTTSALNQG